MSYEEERRAAGMDRIPVQALVEICGRDVGGAPAFEAESVDVSGRGMHLRTAYLPEVGAPLVCRFENGGQEIVVEGEVAWASSAERGGEFGVKFTALDSGSVEALRTLCGIGETATESEPETEAAPSEAPPEAGKRVRLHIDGLGSPMKASVRGGGSRSLQVASNLEFLKVGRHLEIEDVAAGGRRGAEIDSVNVVIDPSTRVPQLVVALRFDDGQESTPEPSVIDAESDGTPAGHVAASAAFAASASTDDDEAIFEEESADEDEEVIEDAQAMRGRLAHLAVDAGGAAKKGGAVVAKAGVAAAAGLGRFFKGAGEKVMEIRKQKAEAAAPKRTTAPPPSGVLSAAGQRLRPQSSVASAEPTEEPAPPISKKKQVKKIAAASALGVLLLTVGVLAMKKPSAPPGANAGKEPAASVAVVANPTGNVTQVDEQGNPVAADAPAEPAASGSGATANVPLFGPTAMATMEPAPLGPAPATDDSAGAADDDQPADDEAKEKAAASAAVEDQVFGDSSAKGDDDEGKAPEGSKGPWGNGRMREPLIHRLRLDKAGTVIQGAANATGFTVVLPGVKVMESAKGIERRDKRIARIKTKNSTSGAEINFQFRDGIPGYRVRLKKDYVEFLISAAKGDTQTVASTGGKKTKKHHKKSASSSSKASKQSTSSKTKSHKKSATKKSKKKG
jgi:hypothetical protein